MKHNYYHNIGRFIGYYYGVSPVLSKYPEGDAGDYFLNGETCSLWMWDAASATWIDTNRVDSGLQQMLTDEEGNSPSDYVPSPSVGIKEAYFYVAENADCDEDESASPREITFTYFKNGNSSVSVEVRKTSIVILYWNGDYWETSVVPMNVDLSLYAKDADLQAETGKCRSHIGRTKPSHGCRAGKCRQYCRRGRRQDCRHSGIKSTIVKRYALPLVRQYENI